MTGSLPFVKMEGCGNDYVYVDLAELGSGLAERLQADVGAIARAISDRHFGVGGDGLILIGSSARADASMHMFNSDGTRGSMCGNALRCIAKYLGDGRMAGASSVRIDTDAGVRVAQLVREGEEVAAPVAFVDVDMDAPSFAGDAIPLDPERAVVREAGGERPWRLEVEIAGERLDGYAMSMGNPHLTVFVRDVDALDLARVGPPLENAAWFPDRANVEFVVATDTGLRQRTWERGSGETLACGSGACAAAVAAISAGLVGREQAVPVALRGGELSIRWLDSGSVRMRGPARVVFRGDWPIRSVFP